MKIINESHSSKDNQLKHLMGMYGMNEGVSSAVQNWLDDENEDDDTLSYDFDDAFDFDNGEVTQGGKFIEDGREWTWVRQVSDVAHLDFDSWAVWMAIAPKDENNPGGPNDVAFFIVDVDNGFIDWGPVESADEANEFLQSKIDDYEMDESVSDDIRKNNLKYDDDVDGWYTTDGNTEVQFQDRETHTHNAKYPHAQPKTSTNTWGRVWKDGKLDKQFEGPKYKVRQDVARYLDKDESINESNIKFKKEYMLGGDNKHPELDDYVSKYIADDGTEIEVNHGFSNWSDTWYTVNGKHFDNLKDAKDYIRNNKDESLNEDNEKKIPYNLVSSYVILRDYISLADDNYFNDEHKYLTDVADSLYNAAISPNSLKGKYKDVYEKYGKDYFDKVLKDCKALDSQVTHDNLQELIDEVMDIANSLDESLNEGKIHTSYSVEPNFSFNSDEKTDYFLTKNGKYEVTYSDNGTFMARKKQGKPQYIWGNAFDCDDTFIHNDEGIVCAEVKEHIGLKEDLPTTNSTSNSYVSPVVNKKSDGSYLVKNKDGKSYTAFDKEDKPVGSITTNNENDAKNKFTSNKYDESLNEDSDNVYKWYSESHPTDYQLDNIKKTVTFKEVFDTFMSGEDVENVLIDFSKEDPWLDSAPVDTIVNHALELYA